MSNSKITMDKLKLQLQCAKSWSDLLPNEAGAFCKTCETNLVDFTTFSNAEIAEYLAVNVDKKVCGRFTKTQLHSESPALFQPLAQFSLKAVVLGVAFGSLLSFDLKAESSDVLGGTIHFPSNTMVINTQLKVVESNGKTAVPLAKITLKSVNGIELETVYSTLDGTFSFTNMVFGEMYTIVIEADGHKTRTVVYTFDRTNELLPIRLAKK